MFIWRTYCNTFVVYLYDEVQYAKISDSQNVYYDEQNYPIS